MTIFREGMCVWDRGQVCESVCVWNSFKCIRMLSIWGYYGMCECTMRDSMEVWVWKSVSAHVWDSRDV